MNQTEMAGDDLFSNMDIAEGPALYPWRNITHTEVLKSLDGTQLGGLISALSKNYRPAGPLPIMLLQGIMMMSLGLTHRGTPEIIERHRKNYLNDHAENVSFETPPAYKSQVVIRTGTGNVPNIYGLIVAPSSTGKGISIPGVISAAGYQEYHKASIEGLQDAAMNDPHILLSLPEFSACLGDRRQKGFKESLTDLFNHGTFKEVLSKRKNTHIREADWFYPTVMASIQPESLNRVGRLIDLKQGLLTRFLIGYLSEEDMTYEINPCNPDIGSDSIAFQERFLKLSRLEGIIEVPDPNYNTVFMAPFKDKIASSLLPLLNRYANEYLPRLALILSLPLELTEGFHLEITMEHLRCATTLLQYIFAMAERALGGLNDLEGYSRETEENIGKMIALIKRICHRYEKKLVMLSEISRNSSGTGWDANRRMHILNELLSRKYIKIQRHKKNIEALKDGCEIFLNENNLPPECK